MFHFYDFFLNLNIKMSEKVLHHISSLLLNFVFDVLYVFFVCKCVSFFK